MKAMLDVTLDPSSSCISDFSSGLGGGRDTEPKRAKSPPWSQSQKGETVYFILQRLDTAESSMIFFCTFLLLGGGSTKKSLFYTGERE